MAFQQAPKRLGTLHLVPCLCTAHHSDGVTHSQEVRSWGANMDRVPNSFVLFFFFFNSHFTLGYFWHE